MDNVRILKHKKNQSKAKGWTCSTKQKKKHYTEGKEREGAKEEWRSGRVGEGKNRQTAEKPESRRSLSLSLSLSVGICSTRYYHIYMYLLYISNKINDDDDWKLERAQESQK